LLSGFHVRSIQPIATSLPLAPDSLNQIGHFFEDLLVSATNDKSTANMSDYGGDDEPMDYAMGECASPLRNLSQEH
jgi:hypothetical protein